jgi:hypothetical protein
MGILSSSRLSVAPIAGTTHGTWTRSVFLATHFASIAASVPSAFMLVLIRVAEFICCLRQTHLLHNLQDSHSILTDTNASKKARRCSELRMLSESLILCLIRPLAPASKYALTHSILCSACLPPDCFVPLQPAKANSRRA